MKSSRKRPDPRARLVELAAQLPETALQSVLDFAEYLAEQSDVPEKVALKPELIPRPETESVVMAMKRLRQSYPMLDHGKMLHEASALMAQHLIQGRPAPEVIDDLEQMFLRYYERYAAGSGD